MDRASAAAPAAQSALPEAASFCATATARLDLINCGVPSNPRSAAPPPDPRPEGSPTGGVAPSDLMGPRHRSPQADWFRRHDQL